MMTLIANAVVLLIALLHIYILVLEMFWWTSPKGQKAFNLTPEFAQATKVLAANQGLYNGFLAAGLLWGLSGWGLGGGASSAAWAVKVFFALCILVAGLYGAATASKKILYIQALPALLALGLLLTAAA